MARTEELSENQETFPQLLVPKVSSHKLWTDHRLTQLLINRVANRTYFDRFKVKQVSQRYLLCEINSVLNGLHCELFYERLNSERERHCSILASITIYKLIHKASEDVVSYPRWMKQSGIYTSREAHLAASVHNCIHIVLYYIFIWYM